MFAVSPRDNEAGRSDRGPKAVMTERRFCYPDVGEWRVAKHDVERPARVRVEISDDVRHDDLGPRRELGGLEVAAERLHRLGAALDEGRTGGSARQRLDPQCPCPGEEVENPGACELGLEDREEGLSDSIGRRSCAAAARYDQRSSLCLPGDHP